MEHESTGLLEAWPKDQRVLGRFVGDKAGPSLIILAGIHGNEPSGIRASRRVIEGLQRIQPQLCGEVVFLAGNLGALGNSVRFVDIDLNRAWTSDKILRGVDPERRYDEPAEFAELRELLAVLREIVGRTRGQIHFLELHTSSAEGPPFVTIGDTLRNRNFARQFPLPLILGLEEQVDGALLEYLNNFGFLTMGVEAGKHDSESSADRHEAVLWLALVHSGLVDESEIPDVAGFRKLLEQASRDVPRVVEVRHRHAIESDDRFRMQPGFSNFQPIRKGQLMAHDRNGPILSPEDGLALLPLYQGQGDDGFFVSREVRSFWLSVSSLLRRLGVGRLIQILPGVRRHPDYDELLIVDTRVARFYPLEVFHLFGFRKHRANGNALLVSRRRYDLQAPAEIAL